VGIDHGTHAVRFAIIGDKVKTFSFARSKRKLSKEEVLTRLFKHVDKKEIALVALTYSMGDAINEILPLEIVEGRGLVSNKGAGEYVGTGTQIYDIIKNSGLKSILIPGLHKGCDFLDTRFRALYSHCGSADKVCASYHAYLRFSCKNMIVSNLGASSVSVAIKNGKIVGGLDACILGCGLKYGPLDVEAIRKIDAGEISANEAFSHSGLGKLGFSNVNSLIEGIKKDEKSAKVALESLILSTAMCISALFPLYPKKPAVVLTGSVPHILGEKLFIKPLERMFYGLELYRLDNTAACKGAAEIARAVFEGKKEILGIKIHDSLYN